MTDIQGVVAKQVVRELDEASAALAKLIVQKELGPAVRRMVDSAKNGTLSADLVPFSESIVASEAEFEAIVEKFK